MPVSKEVLRNIKDEIADHAEKIEKLFRPGAKVTVLVRNPNFGKDHSADVLVTNDKLDDVFAALEHLKTREEIR